MTEIVIKAFKLHDVQKSFEDQSDEYVKPLCEELRARGFTITQIDMNGIQF